MSLGLCPGLQTTSKSAVYKVRQSAVSATASHQGSTPRLNRRPHSLLNLHRKHSSSSRKLSHPYADDTVLYSAGPSPDFVLNALQQSVLSVQQALPLTLS